MTRGGLIYTQESSNLQRVAQVERRALSPRIVQFVCVMYEVDQLIETRRFSTAGLAESCADQWCGKLDYSCG